MPKSTNVINIPVRFNGKTYLISDREPKVGDTVVDINEDECAVIESIIKKNGITYVIRNCDCGECTMEDRTSPIEVYRTLIEIHNQPNPFIN